METQRKIELQAPDDLAYLLANVRRAAAQRIDEAFPAVEGAQDEDELRSRIERLVDEVCVPSSSSLLPEPAVVCMRMSRTVLVVASSSGCRSGPIGTVAASCTTPLST